jgi:teichoic acid transport system permease protein
LAAAYPILDEEAFAMDNGDAPDIEANLTAVNAPVSTRAYLTEMWHRRDFAVAVPLEQLRSAHKTTLLGNLWHLGNPLLTIAVFYFIFGVLLKSNRGIDHYLLWLTIGVFTFRLTSSSVLGGATSISANKGLIRAIKFPRAMLPISVVISHVLTFGIELGLLAAFTMASGVGLSRRLLALPVILIVHTALNTGGAFVASRLNEAFRDVQQIIPFLFRLLQYLSGVMFPIQRFLGDGIPGWAKQVISLNPVLRIIELYRWAFLGTEVDVGATLKTAGMALVLLWFGFRYFRAAEWRYGRA